MRPTLRRALDWAYRRHTNQLSWYIRPLWILPLGYAAWRRSGTGIALSLAGLLTSMVWFPAPDRVDPRVQRFLDMERTSSSTSGRHPPRCWVPRPCRSRWPCC